MKRKRKMWRASTTYSKSWSPPRLTVLDINVLRDREQIQAVAREAYEIKGGILIPIVFLAELTKNPQHWAKTLHGSLVELHPFDELVLCGAELNHIMAKESALGSPIIEYADRNATKGLSGMMAAATGGVDALEAMLAKYDVVETTRADAPFLQDHDGNKWNLGRTIAAFRDCLAPEDISTLRNSDVDLRRRLIAEYAYYEACKAWPDKHSDRRRTAMYMRNSVESRMFMAAAAVPLLWLATGGFETRKAESVTNDFADLWYIILGSLTERLRSNDRRVVQLADDISAASKMVGLCEPGDWCTKLDEWIDPDLIRLMGENAARVLKKTYDVRAHPEKYFNEVPTWLKKS